MYKKFAIVAKKEGFNEIAKKFEAVGEVEKLHEQKYDTIQNEINSGKEFKSSGKTT
jgi:rubrerythrin